MLISLLRPSDSGTSTRSFTRCSQSDASAASPVDSTEATAIIDDNFHTISYVVGHLKVISRHAVVWLVLLIKEFGRHSRGSTRFYWFHTKGSCVNYGTVGKLWKSRKEDLLKNQSKETFLISKKALWVIDCDIRTAFSMLNAHSVDSKSLCILYYSIQ